VSAILHFLMTIKGITTNPTVAAIELAALRDIEPSIVAEDPALKPFVDLAIARLQVVVDRANPPTHAPAGF